PRGAFADYANPSDESPEGHLRAGRHEPPYLAVTSRRAALTLEGSQDERRGGAAGALGPTPAGPSQTTGGDFLRGRTVREHYPCRPRRDQEFRRRLRRHFRRQEESGPGQEAGRQGQGQRRQEGQEEEKVGRGQ